MATNNAINAPLPISLSNGGTNANLAANNGGIFYSTASAAAVLAGTATALQMLQSGASTTPAWSTATWPATTTINQILYSSSASVVAGLATVNSANLVTSSTGVPTWIGAMTNGQLPIGSTGATPVAAAISAGTNISVTNGAGTITIAATGVAGFTWVDQNSSSVTMAVNTGYVIDNGASLVTATLPSTAALGSIFKIAGSSSGGWKIGQAASQNIKFGNQTTTTGTGGSLASSLQYDSVELVCVVANTTFVVLSSVGNITYV
jgi:hypothetical protein